jgi:thioredoxin 1
LAVELNADNYDAEVIKSTVPVMVDFWGPQCRPCLALMPAVEQLEEEYAGKIKVAKLNPAAGNRMLCARLRVLSLPTFLFYKDGVEAKRLSGDSITRSDLLQAISEVVV